MLIFIAVRQHNDAWYLHFCLSVRPSVTLSRVVNSTWRLNCDELCENARQTDDNDVITLIVNVWGHCAIDCAPLLHLQLQFDDTTNSTLCHVDVVTIKFHSICHFVTVYRHRPEERRNISSKWNPIQVPMQAQHISYLFLSSHFHCM